MRGASAETGEELRMAEANGLATADQVARPRESGLAVRLQLRSAQPDPTAATDGATADKAQGEVCLNNDYRPPEMFPEARRPLEIPDRTAIQTDFSAKRNTNPQQKCRNQTNFNEFLKLRRSVNFRAMRANKLT